MKSVYYISPRGENIHANVLTEFVNPTDMQPMYVVWEPHGPRIVAVEDTNAEPCYAHEPVIDYRVQ